MPIFYGDHKSGTTTEAETHGSQGEDVRKSPSPPMRFRRSISPELGSMTLRGEDGRLISRGELIERLKSSRKCLESAEKEGKTPPKTPEETLLAGSKPTLLPSPELEDGAHRITSDQNYSAGLDIERPRSALHSGDFREERDLAIDAGILTSPFSTATPDDRRQDIYSIFSSRSQSFEQRPRSRSGHAPPLPNFQFLAPTSPLIHTSLNPDLERQRSPSPSNRRHTSSPPSFKRSSTNSPFTKPTRPPAYQAHQPLRSISIPQTPRQRPRGLSISSEASPLHYAPLVGSYEESILRGRMSTTPSRPLDFVAQVGVLARGKCAPSLRCPPHVSATFPAVFYSYPSTSGRPPIVNSPSPYVGLLNIEQSFPGSSSKAAPPGGSYRIPPAGQLQIILKNPNATAVKLFLVPYDVRAMPPGTKTFIRQRSYTAGPIIDMPLSSRTNLGTDRPEAALSTADDPTERPVLRYLVHLNICSPAKGRWFLYKSMRLVFANRVPDDRESLRCEVQLPEPRYTPYKPSESSAAALHNSPKPLRRAGLLGLEARAARRRSTPVSFGSAAMDAVDGLGPPPPVRGGLSGLVPLATLVSRPVSREQMDIDHPAPVVKDEETRQGRNAEATEIGSGNDADQRQQELEKWLSQRWHPSETPRDV